MTYIVLGLSALVGLGLMGRWLLTSEPKTILKALKWTGLILLLCLGAYIMFRGRLDYLLYLAGAALPFLLRWGGLARTVMNAAKAARGPSPGQTSSIRTHYLDMTLNHDSGDMDGMVIAGTFAGSRLSDLDVSGLADLMADVEDDPQSVQILEAWLDRVHGDAWREAGSEQPGSGQSGSGQPGGGRAGGSGGGEPEMTHAYALSLLGLDEGATEAEIRAAHKRLMLANHPDRGGSSVLAAQINRAKDILLQD